jgi:deoxyribodipyrimidine photo-lyase
MGIHDQGWKERPVFGKIRFMNYAGCKRKFKVATFVAQYPGASENAVNATQKHSNGSKGEKRETAASDPVKKKKPKTSA